MRTGVLSQSLASFIEYLDGLPGRPPLDELRGRLEQSDITWDDVAPFAHFSEKGYVRNLIRAGDHYHLLALCWKSGQRSPIHDHAQSACAFRVIKGTATETVFERTRGGHIKASFSRDWRCGQIVATQDDDIHQVSNLEPDEDLVTLHLYTPPLMKMATYSLFDARRGEDIVVFLGHTDGGGI